MIRVKSSSRRRTLAGGLCRWANRYIVSKFPVEATLEIDELPRSLYGTTILPSCEITIANRCDWVLASVVLAHEIAHVYAYKMYGLQAGNGHGAKFKQVMLGIIRTLSENGGILWIVGM